MKSKRFFNKALVSHAIGRSWAMSLFLLFFKFVAVVIPVYSSHIEILRTENVFGVQDSTASFSFSTEVYFVYMIAAALIALGLAFVLFGFLCSERSTLMMHSFPVNRSQLFFSNYLVGLLALIIPDLLCSAICAPRIAQAAAEIAKNAVDAGTFISETKSFILASPLVILFLWSTAVLSVMLSGNSVGVIASFLIINFAPSILLVIADDALYDFAVGYAGGSTDAFEFQPLLKMLELTKVEGWFFVYCLILSVVCVAAAFAAYKKRKLELTGETFLFPFMKIVFQLSAVIGAAYALCVFINEVIGVYHPSAPAFILEFIAFAFVAFLLSEMLIERTFRPIKGKSMLRFLILTVAVAGVFFGVKAYYENRTVDPSKVEKATVSTNFILEMVDKEGIEVACSLQEKLIDRTKEQTDDDNFWWTVSLEFEMKNGRTVKRFYAFNTDPSHRDEEGSPESILASLGTEERLETGIFGARIDELELSKKYRSEVSDEKSSITLDPEKDKEFVEQVLQAIIDDLRHGAYGIGDALLQPYRDSASIEREYREWWDTQPEKRFMTEHPEIEFDSGNFSIKVYYTIKNDDHRLKTRSVSPFEREGRFTGTYEDGNAIRLSGDSDTLVFPLWVDPALLKTSTIVGARLAGEDIKQ